jgi:hypothetical protein
MRKREGNQNSSAQQSQPKFQRSEFYEALLRLRRDQPRRFKFSISLASQRSLAVYERQKALAAKKRLRKLKRVQKRAARIELRLRSVGNIDLVEEDVRALLAEVRVAAACSVDPSASVARAD